QLRSSQYWARTNNLINSCHDERSHGFRSHEASNIPMEALRVLEFDARRIKTPLRSIEESLASFIPRWMEGVPLRCTRRQALPAALILRKGHCLSGALDHLHGFNLRAIPRNLVASLTHP